MKALTPPLKWHGGKSYLAKRIVALMPPHIHYVEPFFGGGSVLLAKDPEGVSEVANDLNGELTNFWRVIANENYWPRFFRCVSAIPFSETEFEAAVESWQDGHGVTTASINSAVRFFVRCRQSLAGRMHSFAPLSRTRTRRGMNEQASAWIGAVDGLPAVHARLRRVAILNQPAVDVIRSQDGPGTLFYCDPPYLHETRATTGEYTHEMTFAQHEDLVNVLGDIRGKFLLSGYRSELYDEAASAGGWNRHDFDLANNAAGGKTKRRMTECVWCNY